MLKCAKCGTENEVGRVFCAGCGAKLETSGIRSEDLARMQRKNPLAGHGKKFLIIPVFLVLLLVVLAFNPRPPYIGERGTQLGARRVEAQLKGFAALTEGRSMATTFAEGDVNAYIEAKKIGAIRADALSMAAGEGYLAVRMARAMQPRKIGSFRVAPRMTWDYLFVPVGGRLSVRKAYLGRLSLSGPMRTAAVRALLATVGSEKEWACFRHATEIEVSRGQVVVHVAR
ncbi:MAG: zinc ribbon domain-containing protein [Lentisphaerae bacterium]|nr:zinc ribbon domain-containing protein [Lentisphaerota bacterium]